MRHCRTGTAIPAVRGRPVATLLIVVFVMVTGERAVRAASFRRGDSNTDGRVDVSDSLRSLSFLFLGDSSLPCLDAADADDSGGLDITDVLFTFSFLFLGGPNPPAPFGDCGDDPTTDDLDCAAYDPPADEGCGAATQARFTVSPPGGAAPLTVRLNALESFSPVGPILEYAWSLGDGARATDPVVSHTYPVPGSYSVELTVTGRDGAEATATRLVEVEGIRATTIVVTHPTTGETGVSLRRETVIDFRRPVTSESWPDAIVTSFGGEILPGRYQLSQGGHRVSLFYFTDAGDPLPLPASARIRVTIDGDAILDDLGRAVDADGDGEPGGIKLVDFDTIPLVSIPGTSVAGTVMASERATLPGGPGVDVPLAGVTVRVDGAEDRLSAVTGADGRFVLEDAPAGRVFVHVDGRTANADVPSGEFYPIVGKAWKSVPGLQVDVGTIYLPLIAAGTLRPVSDTAPTTIPFPPSVLARFPDLAGVSVTVPADSIFSDDGTRGGAVGIGPVAPDRLPETLPLELQFPLVITVQTDGATNFDRPVPVTFPNLPDPATGETLPPGAKTGLWSFDHDRGQWDLAGPATVSSDGTMILSDPGTGIRAPGWHGTNPSASGRFDPFSFGDSGDDADPFAHGPDSFMEGVEPDERVKTGPGVDPGGLGGPGDDDDDGNGDGEDEDECKEFEAFATRVNTVASCVPLISRYLPVLHRLLESLNDANSLLGALKTARQNAALGNPDVAQIKNIVAALTEVKKLIHGLLQILEASPANPLANVMTALNCASAFLELLQTECDRANTLPEKCFPEGESSLKGCDKEAIETLKTIVDAVKQVVSLVQTSLRDFGFAAACVTLEEVGKYLEQQAQQGGGGGVTDPVLIELLDAALRDLEPFDALAEEDTAAASSFLGELAEYLAVMGDADARRRGVATDASVLIEFGEAIQRLRSDSRGGFEAILPANVPVSVTVFDPRDRHIGSTIVITSEAGTETALPYPILAPDDSDDGDEDGLGSRAEFVVGTDPANPDTDGDGLSDGAEIAQGTNPLDGLVAQTGILATVPLPDAGYDVCLVEGYAVVAHGRSGVSVIDVRPGRPPATIAQVDTAGFAESVACAGSLLVVADGDAGLTLIDASDPPAARILNTIPVGGVAKRVVVRAGLAFVASRRGLKVVDVVTGTLLQTSTLPRTIRDLALDGTSLWVLSSETGRIGSTAVDRFGLDARLGDPEEHFEIDGLEYPSYRSSGLFVTPRNVWLAGIYDRPGGAPGVAVLERREGGLALISPPSPIIAFDIALDGAGRALFAGLNGVFDLADVGLLDVSDPSRSGSILGGIELTGHTRAVAIAGGVGYVVSRNLHVIGYVDWDRGGVPPEIDFVPSALTSSRQLVEGTAVAIAVDAVDDVQVRQVDFLVDGEVARSDSTYPFEVELVAPARADQGSIVLAARAVDTGGNTSVSRSLQIEIIADTTPPVILSETPPTGKPTRVGGQDLFVSFSEALDEATLDAEDITLVGAGADDAFDTADDVVLEPAVIAYRSTVRLVRVGFEEPFPPGLYHASVGPLISDLVGNPLSELHTWDFEITEIPDLSRQGSFLVESASTADEVTYSFLAPPGQLVYFDELTTCNEADIFWECSDEDGASVFGRQALEACGFGDPGRLVLERGGRYDLRITGIGSFSFAVWNVVIDEFDLEIGDSVSEDLPLPGAGRLSAPGEMDVYGFRATAGTEVYFEDLFPECGEVDIVWQVEDEDGTRLFRADDPLSACGLGRQGSVTLERGGLYTLTVESRAGGRGDVGEGAYAFRLWEIEPGEFTVAIGDTVSDGVPAPGAGSVESPGNYDIYRFEAAPGTSVRFDELAPDCDNNFEWELLDADGTVLSEADDLRVCGFDPGNGLTLERGGTYTIIVRAKFDRPVTGTYSFALVRQ